ncbi:hypothetical protein CDD83_4667 [Cordyceps sp. RAO-2017]|nr:hypothetical protein CDD83_4667 [Cordyceps sp. RAO-2017]
MVGRWLRSGASLLLAAPLHLAAADLIPGAYLFQLERHHDTAAFLSAVQTHGTIQMELKFELFNGASVQFNDLRNVDRIASEIAALPVVKKMWPMQNYSQPDEGVKWVSAPIGDTKSSNLRARSVYEHEPFPAHAMTQVDRLHANGVTGRGIKIAVIDSGVDYTHPALGGGCFGPGCLVARGYDFVGDAFDGSNTPHQDEDPMDCGGHGTHVAGIIAAQPGNMFGFTGAAPGVTLAAYRVFGCRGGTRDDVLIAALNRAYEDGADIISLSLGSPSGWSEHPWSAAVSDVVAKGVACLVSAANDGEMGLFYASTAADGKRVTAIAAFENIVHHVLQYDISYTVDGGPSVTVGFVQGEPADWSNVSLPLWAGSFDVEAPADGCAPLPSDAPDLKERIVLIRRGSCTFKEKINNARAKGARYILVYNNAPRAIELDLDIPALAGVGMVSAEAGHAWIKLLAEGKKVVVDMVSYRDAKPHLINTPNREDGGALLEMNSWGPTWQMDVKPQFGAVGGTVLSTYPVKKGGYAVWSGTSQACPQVAAIYALIAQVRGGRVDPGLFESLLSANADPQLFHNGKTFLPYLAPVAQQGGGIVRAYDAAYATTLLEPSSLSFNDTQGFLRTLNLTIKNTESRDITYTVSHVPAITMYTLQNGSITPQSFPNDVVHSPADLAFNGEERLEVVVGGGDTRAIRVAPTPPQGLNADRLALWSGYIAVNGSDGSSLSIPYQGLTGSLQNATVLGRRGTWIAKSTDKGPYDPVPTNTTFTLPRPGSSTANATLPSLRVELTLGSPLVLADVVAVAGARRGAAIGRMADFPQYWLPRLSFSVSWNGTLSTGQYAEAGRYKIVTRALRIRGDEAKDGDYDVSESQVFSIRYA